MTSVSRRALGLALLNMAGVLVIVGALTRDLNLRRLERYLALAWASGADPVLLLNKADMIDVFEFDVAAFERGVRMVNADVEIIHISCKTNQGLDQWTEKLRQLVIDSLNPALA